MNTQTFSESLTSAIHIAQQFAKEFHNEKYSSAHFLRGLLHKDAGLHNLLNALGKDISYMTEWAEIRMEDQSGQRYAWKTVSV